MSLAMDSPAFAAVLIVSLAGFVGVIVRMAVVHRRFVQRLRTRHPGVWSELSGPPESFSRLPWAARQARARVAYYLYLREFRGLPRAVARCPALITLSCGLRSRASRIRAGDTHFG